MTPKEEAGLDIRSTSISATSYFYVGLVLGCIDADLCKLILIFQHLIFSRSTRSTFLRTGRNSKNLQKFVWNFADFFEKINIFQSNSSFFALVLMKIHRNFNILFEICEEFSRFHSFQRIWSRGVAKNGKIIFDKIRIFRRREYPVIFSSAGGHCKIMRGSARLRQSKRWVRRRRFARLFLGFFLYLLGLLFRKLSSSSLYDAEVRRSALSTKLL